MEKGRIEFPISFLGPGEILYKMAILNYFAT